MDQGFEGYVALCMQLSETNLAGKLYKCYMRLNPLMADTLGVSAPTQAHNSRRIHGFVVENNR